MGNAQMAANDVHVFADSSALSCAQNCVTCRPHTYEIQPGVREQRITVGVEFYARMIRKEVKAMFIRTVRAARVPVRKPSIIVCIPEAAYKLMFVTENLIIDDATHLENALGEKWGHHEVLCEDEFDGNILQNELRDEDDAHHCSLQSDRPIAMDNVIYIELSI